MEQQTITTVWNEVRVTSEGISVSLLSETSEGGAVVEDEAWFTFEELAAMSPSEPLSLNLSDETKEALSEMRTNAERYENVLKIKEIVNEEPTGEHSSLLEVGDVVEDENPPSFPDAEEELVVVEVMESVSCEEYVIQGQNEGTVTVPAFQKYNDKTVADANPSYDEDGYVVNAVYKSDIESLENYDESDVYAFPAARLTRKP